MSHKPNIHSLLVAANLFQLEEFPLKWRVLMAMATKCNHECVSWLSAAKICVMLGEVDEEGRPTPDGMKAVRAARQALTKSGILTYFTEVVDAETEHRWRLNLHAFKPGFDKILSKNGVPEDRWANKVSPASEEQSNKPSKSPKPTVEEVAPEGEGEELEEVKGPSADDVALRQAVLARSRQEREEEARREAEEAKEVVPEPKKSVVTWDLLFSNGN